MLRPATDEKYDRLDTLIYTPPNPQSVVVILQINAKKYNVRTSPVLMDGYN
jgi:hypothetical protein